MHKSLDSDWDIQSDIDNALNSNVIKFKIIQQNSKKSEISHWLLWTWTLICSQRLMSNDLVIWNFSNLSGYIQIFPDLFRLFQIYSDILQFIQINSDKLQFAANLYICLSFWSLPLSLSLPQCLANNWIWLNKMQLCNLNILLFFWIYSDLSRIIQIFSDQFGFIQICPDLFRLIQIYSD